MQAWFNGLKKINCYSIFSMCMFVYFSKQLDFRFYNTFTLFKTSDFRRAMNDPSDVSQYEFTNSPWHAHEPTLLPHATGTFPLRKHVGYFLQIPYAREPLLCLCKSPHM